MNIKERYETIIRRRYSYMSRHPFHLAGCLSMKDFAFPPEIEKLPYGVARDKKEAKCKDDYFNKISEAIRMNDRFLVGELIIQQVKAQMLTKAKGGIL